jgi:Cu(I)/Ag(I) efflux system membrane fusion protein
MKEGKKMGEKHGIMLAAVTKAANANDIKTIRAELKPISDHLIHAAKNHGYEELLYVQFCPMADDNNGAYWLSTSKDVLNPYYGSMMLKCGSVKETIGEEKK